jgi:peptidoglycan/xylan/chitin deacetylase (PgdA/CDA1 family)
MIRAQLAMLRREGYRVATLDDLWTETPARTEDREHSVVLTFDDGRSSDFEVAFSLLAESGAGAEFFVNTATVGTADHLSWSQMRTMHRAGMSLQSHSHDHVILIGLPIARLRQQLGDSRRRLEDGLGAPVRYLAAPYGLASRRVVRAALDAGYRAVCTSGEWMARPGARTISRLALYPTTRLEEFCRLLQGTPAALARRRLRVGLAYVPKRVLLRVRRRSLERAL